MQILQGDRRRIFLMLLWLLRLYLDLSLIRSLKTEFPPQGSGSQRSRGCRVKAEWEEGKGARFTIPNWKRIMGAASMLVHRLVREPRQVASRPVGKVINDSR